MTDLKTCEQEHQAWIARACEAVGVAPAEVDVPLIHDLTRVVAHELARPMAPVSSFILGLALGSRPDAAPHALADRLKSTVDDQ